MASRGLFPGASSNTGELSKTNSHSVEQKLLGGGGMIVFIDDILLTVG